jgi:hypothetical protein
VAEKNERYSIKIRKTEISPVRVNKNGKINTFLSLIFFYPDLNDSRALLYFGTCSDFSEVFG